MAEASGRWTVSRDTAEETKDLTNRLILNYFNRMPSTMTLISLATVLLLSAVWLLYVVYQRRLIIYKLRRQGIVSQRHLSLAAEFSDNAQSQRMRDGAGGQATSLCFISF